MRCSIPDSIAITITIVISTTGGANVSYPLGQTGLFLADSLAALSELAPDYSLVADSADHTEISAERIDVHKRDVEKLARFREHLDTYIDDLASAMKWVCGDLRSKTNVLRHRDNYHPAKPLAEADGRSFIETCLNTQLSILAAVANLTSCPEIAKALAPHIQADLEQHFMFLLEAHTPTPDQAVSPDRENGDVRVLMAKQASLILPTSLESAGIILTNLQNTGFKISIEGGLQERTQLVADRAKMRGNCTITKPETFVAAAAYTVAIRLVRGHTQNHLHTAHIGAKNEGVYVANRCEAYLRSEMKFAPLALDDAKRAVRAQPDNKKFVRRLERAERAFSSYSASVQVIA